MVDGRRALQTGRYHRAAKERTLIRNDNDSLDSNFMACLSNNLQQYRLTVCYNLPADIRLKKSAGVCVCVCVCARARACLPVCVSLLARARVCVCDLTIRRHNKVL